MTAADRELRDEEGTEDVVDSGAGLADLAVGVPNLNDASLGSEFAPRFIDAPLDAALVGVVRRSLSTWGRGGDRGNPSAKAWG